MALRDLSLRFVAGQVDQELEGIVAGQGLGLPPVAERVMAVVDESPGCRRALRRAASLASALHAPLLAVAVETPAIRQSRDRLQNLQANLDYAVDLGAEIIRGEAIGPGAEGWRRSSVDRRISHVVLVHRPRRALGLGRPSLADRLLDEVPGLEIHLVGEPGRGTLSRASPGRYSPTIDSPRPARRRSAWPRRPDGSAAASLRRRRLT